MRELTKVLTGCVVVALIMACALVFIACGPKPPEVTVWYPWEVVGQGRLTSVDYGDGMWLLGLESMKAESTPDNIIKCVFVYSVGPDLRVGGSGGDYTDMRRFKLGEFYVLYRKVEGCRVRFYLDAWPD